MPAGAVGLNDKTDMLPEQKLIALLTRHKAIEDELSTQLATEAFVRLSREFAELSPVVDAVKAYREVVAEIDGLQAMIDDPKTDAEMREMAAAEKPALEQKRAALEQRIKVALLPKDAMDDRNVIIEIGAGTGGDEASLFAGDLFRMYERFAAEQGWKVEVVSASKGAMGGYKEIIAEIKGRGASPSSSSKSGVHRVQRVPTPRPPGASTPPPRRLRCCGSRRGRHRHQRERSADRHPARQRRRRPASTTGVGHPGVLISPPASR